jgi:hypothetical protein
VKKLSLFASVIVVGVGTAASMLPHDRPHNIASTKFDLAEITNGAFRDGLYLGKLTAQRGAALNIPTGRWSSSVDRVSFTAGYRQGYTEFLASQAASESRGQQAE